MPNNGLVPHWIIRLLPYRSRSRTRSCLTRASCLASCSIGGTDRSRKSIRSSYTHKKGKETRDTIPLAGRRKEEWFQTRYDCTVSCQ
jgi:hypothetical protein